MFFKFLPQKGMKYLRLGPPAQRTGAEELVHLRVLNLFMSRPIMLLYLLFPMSSLSKCWNLDE